MIHYPIELQTIFDKLSLFEIEPIIVGGFIRDALLGNSSKDIDIELYGAASLSKVEEILSEFGSVNSVGRSFGVCKLRYKSYDLDFSLPRRENKIADGHKGFDVVTEKNLDFKTATSRRDFTINAIGMNPKTHLILDPFNGISDLKNKKLTAVNLQTFDEDPLRVLRCVQFASRFELEVEEKLFFKCKEMIQERMLEELPRERVFTEFTKLLLKSMKPSSGLWLLDSLGAFSFFKEFEKLSDDEKEKIFHHVDRLALKKTQDEKEKLTLMLALLCQNFSQTQRESFLYRLTLEQKIIKDVENLLSVYRQTPLRLMSNYEVYLLATRIEVRVFLLFLYAQSSKNTDSLLELLQKQAHDLGVYTTPLKALIKGKDLLSLGQKPSALFSKILQRVYDAQMQGQFREKQEALEWVKELLDFRR